MIAQSVSRNYKTCSGAVYYVAYMAEGRRFHRTVYRFDGEWRYYADTAAVYCPARRLA